MWKKNSVSHWISLSLLALAPSLQALTPIYELSPYHATASRLTTLPLPETPETEQPPAPVGWDHGDTEQQLRRLPETTGGSPNRQTTNGGTGVSRPNLSGLGMESTRVQIEGRPAGPFQDISLLHGLANDQFTLRPAGSSPVYGSGAIGGIVDYSFTIPERPTLRAGLNFGDGFHGHQLAGSYQARHKDIVVGIALDWQHEDALMARDRSYTRTDLSDIGGPNIGSSTRDGVGFSAAGIVKLRSGLTSPSSAADYETFNSATDAFDYRQHMSSVPGHDRRSLAFTFDRVYNNHLRLFNRTLITQRRTEIFFAPAPFVITSGATSPYFTSTGSSIFFPFYRSFELGSRTNLYRKNAFWTMFGAEGEEPDLSWKSAFVLGRARARMSMDRTPLKSLLDNEISQGNFNPFALAGSTGTFNGNSWDNAAALERSATTAFDSFEEDFVNFDLHVQRSLFEGTHGPIEALLGLEWQVEKNTRSPDSAFETADAQGFITISPFSARRSARALFGEVNWPLAERLSLNVAGRYDHYTYDGNDPDTNTNVETTMESPTYAARLQYERPGFQLRLGRSTAFRAPTLLESFSAKTTVFPSITDPLGFTPDNSAVAAEFSGNPDLEAEESKHWDLEVIVEPVELPGLRARFQIFRIERENGIADGTQFIINENASSQGSGFPSTSNGTVTVDPNATFAGRITRNADGSLPIDQVTVAVESDNFNVAEVVVDGLDLAIEKEGRHNHFDWRVGAGARYYLRWDLKRTPTATTENRIGQFGDLLVDSLAPGSIPRYRAWAAAQLRRQQYSAGLRMRHTSSLTETYLNQPRRLGSWSVLDLNLGMEWSENLQLSANVDNLFDKDPPISFTAFNDNYDTSLYSSQGRTFRLQVDARF